MSDTDLEVLAQELGLGPEPRRSSIANLTDFINELGRGWPTKILLGSFAYQAILQEIMSVSRYESSIDTQPLVFGLTLCGARLILEPDFEPAAFELVYPTGSKVHTP